MAKNLKKSMNRYTFFGLFLILIVLALIMLNEFLLVLLSALIVVYIFHPVHVRLQRKIKNRNITSFLMTIIVLLVISLPIVIFVSVVTPEVNAFYRDAITKLGTEGLVDWKDCTDGAICMIHSTLTTLFGSEQVESVIKDTLYGFKSYVVSVSSTIIFSIPKIILQGFLLLFVIFFAFRDGNEAMRACFDLLPLDKRFKRRLVDHTRDVIFATVYGNIVIAFIQGGVAMIGFYVFGLQSPVFWGLVTVLAALVPFVGTAMIWVPAGVGKIVLAMMANDGLGVWQGIGLLAYGALLISTIDNIVKPKIIGDRARVHPLLIFLGLIGGISAFGFVGAIIGPLAFALLITFIDVYRREKHEIVS